MKALWNNKEHRTARRNSDLGRRRLLRAASLVACVPAALFAAGASAQCCGGLLTTSEAVGTDVGNIAPDFRLTDIEGKQVTRANLVAQRPGLMFFTATWCLPCIKGLAALKDFQNDLGGAPISVLVVFVDPKETDRDLREFRERFGFPRSWHYALDRDGMARRYSLRYLDTKYVLDRQGVIRYGDVSPADYGTWARALATVGIRKR